MNKILYPPLIFIGVLSPFYVYALIDFSLGSLIAAVAWSPLLILVLWMSMDNFWINRRLPVICPNNYKTVKVGGDTFEQTLHVYDEENDIYQIRGISGNISVDINVAEDTGEPEAEVGKEVHHGIEDNR